MTNCCRTIALPPNGLHLDIGDLDGDGSRDIALAGEMGVGFGLSQAAFDFLESNQLPESVIPGAVFSTDVAVADLDNDGDLDVIRARTDAIDFLLNGESLRADLNLDGQVDFEDFLALSQDFGKQSNDDSPLAADIDKSGEVDFADFCCYRPTLADQYLLIHTVETDFIYCI